MVVDRKEVVGKMEPLLFDEGSRHRSVLIELVVELVKCSAELRSSLSKGLLQAVADVVQTMNSYYSNLIESHDIHPVDIERGLSKNFSDNKEQKNLQLLATAHVVVQKWIDCGGLTGQSTTVKGICEVHRRFVEMVPFEMIGKGLNNEIEQFQVVPGELRKTDVQVGSHISIRPGAVPRFLERFEGAYSQLNTTETILHCAAAHHRLLWIHPFGDGNGRVARLISHAMLLESLETEGVWSIARGLARRESEYKSLLANCDLKRRNDLDGRGNLSEEALAEFTVFFLKTCIDQVQFMKGLLQPEKLLNRIEIWAGSSL